MSRPRNITDDSDSDDDRVTVQLGPIRSVSEMSKKLRKDFVNSLLPITDICKNTGCANLHCRNAHSIEEFTPTLCPYQNNCLYQFTCQYLHPGEPNDLFITKIKTIFGFIKNKEKFMNEMQRLIELNNSYNKPKPPKPRPIKKIISTHVAMPTVRRKKSI